MAHIAIDSSQEKLFSYYKKFKEVTNKIDLKLENHTTKSLNKYLLELDNTFSVIEDAWSGESFTFFKALNRALNILTSIYILPSESEIRFTTEFISENIQLSRSLLDKRVSELKNAIQSYGISFTISAVDDLGQEIFRQSKNYQHQSDKLDDLLKNIEEIKALNIDEIHKKAREIEEIISQRLLDSDHEITYKIIQLTNESSKKFDDFSKQITDKYSEWSNKLVKERDELISKTDEDIKALQERIDNLSFTLESSIKKEVNSFANQKRKLTDILGSLSEFRRSKSDIDQAEKEKSTANQFRWFGLSLMMLPLLAFLIFFVGVSTNSDDTSTLKFVFPDEVTGYFLRFLTIILFSSPSVYLLKESAYHRGQERHYRERGLQLASIGPYLEEFTLEKRIEAKQQLMETFYKSNDGKADTSNVPDFIKNMNEAIKLAHAIKTPHASEPPKREQPNTVNS